MKGYRIKVTNAIGTASYIVRDGAKRTIAHYDGAEQMLALANLFGGDTAEIRFMLLDVESGADAHSNLQNYFNMKGWPTKVELLAGGE